MIINRLFAHIFDQNSTCQRYFLNVLAVTATLNANNAANGKTIKLGCKLNGSARYTTQVITTSGNAAFFA